MNKFRFFLSIFCPLILVFWVFSFSLFVNPVIGKLNGLNKTEVVENRKPKIQKLVLQGAKECIKRKEKYRDRYKIIAYPNGDVPLTESACTDIIIRAYRNANIDLQKLLHEDRVANPKAYPLSLWDFKGTDTSIDHRRCANLFTFFARHGKRVSSSTKKENLKNWQPGHVVFYWNRIKKWHVGIISDKIDKKTELPYIIDNSSDPGYASETHLLTEHTVIWGHFRYPHDE